MVWMAQKPEQPSLCKKKRSLFKGDQLRGVRERPKEKEMVLFEMVMRLLASPNGLHNNPCVQKPSMSLLQNPRSRLCSKILNEQKPSMSPCKVEDKQKNRKQEMA
ncbi:hypothetical protein O6H91_07G050700 [Diphasiastrum complanatum]|uniref:Uncharacterized protein n=1 Tax=Diphasiastrum complanatum TaxID=34168 RepID=A0ACC2D5E0_DIPCM|nr:hypothetical protein O6H91_07G050700 [Diphasiastrum complanatum]